MKTIIIDTDVLIDHSHGFAPWVGEARKQKNIYQLVVPTIVVVEYLASQENENIEELAISQKYLSLFQLLDLTEPIAVELGTILRRRQYSPKASMADLIVAATAIYLIAPLATRNLNHFTNIPRLTFFDPKQL